MELLNNLSQLDEQVKTSVPALVKTRREIATYFKVHVDTVKEWRRKGMPKEPNGLYELTRIAAWRLVNRAHQGESYIYPIVKIDDFKRNRANIYAREQAEAIKIQQTIRHYHFTKEQIQTLEKKEAIILYDQLRRDQKDKFEQERLERGESTENVAVIVAAIKDLKKKRSGNNGK